MSDDRVLTYIYHYAFVGESGVSGDGIYKVLDMIHTTADLVALKEHVAKKWGIILGITITSLSRLGEVHYT